MSDINPSVSELHATLSSLIQARLNEASPVLPKMFTAAFALVLSAVAKKLYNYGGFNALQPFVRTASYRQTTINGRQIVPLVELGVLVGVGTPRAATQAELSVQLTILNPVGTLPAGEKLLSPSTGVTYMTVGSTVLSGATTTARVRAVSDRTDTQGAGVQGNLDAGSPLVFIRPIDSVSSDAIVVDTLVTGTNAETEAVYRQKVIDRFQKKPQGGAYADYEMWAEEVPGIINAYPYRNNITPHVVDVYCEATPESAGNADGIPTAAQLLAVGESIDYDVGGMASRRPVSAVVNPLPITKSAFNVTVTGLTVPTNLGQTQEDVNDVIEIAFNQAEPYIAGLSVGRRREKITRSALIGLVEDVVTAAGGEFGTVTFQLDGVAVNLESYSLGYGEKAKLNGTVTFVGP